MSLAGLVTIAILAGSEGHDVPNIAMILAAALAADATVADLPPLTAKDVKFQIVGGDGRFYPERAQRNEVEGFASALCLIDGGGRLQDCQVTAEKPQDYNFGMATLKLTATLKLADKAKDGSPTAGRRFRFDMNFKLPR